MKEKLSPISAKERIESLDILRGFALLGIMLANIIWFLYPVYMQEDPSFNNEWTSFWNQADYLVKVMLAMFVDGKFVMLDSFIQATFRNHHPIAIHDLLSLSLCES
ncbi:hypothetical protein C3943_13310 [Lysinibacillus sp. B2A1]|nr:hypothetical protein C3943_13310 [Lysinibacillus sp. B2A1]